MTIAAKSAGNPSRSEISPISGLHDGISSETIICMTVTSAQIYLYIIIIIIDRAEIQGEGGEKAVSDEFIFFLIQPVNPPVYFWKKEEVYIYCTYISEQVRV